MKQSCKNCKFYKENYMAESCYRYPKKINTYYKHWCGEWKEIMSDEYKVNGNGEITSVTVNNKGFSG